MKKNINSAERKRNPLSDLTNSSNLSKPHSLSSSSSSTFNTTHEPISVFCSRIHTLNENKRNTKKAMTNPKICNIRDKNDGVELEGSDIPKARVLTVRCKKKRRAVSKEQDVSKDAQLQDYIEKQNVYFKEIDEFKLPEEEVESVYDLD